MSIWKGACSSLLLVLLISLGFNFLFLLRTPESPKRPGPPKPGSTAPQTYYDILGVPKFASDEVLKAGYRLQVKIHHPDKAKDSEKEQATEAMVHINDAYKFLTSRQRCLYDLKLGAGAGYFTACQDKYSKLAVQDFDRKREEERKEREEARQASRENAARKGRSKSTTSTKTRPVKKTAREEKRPGGKPFYKKKAESKKAFNSSDRITEPVMSYWEALSNIADGFLLCVAGLTCFVLALFGGPLNCVMKNSDRFDISHSGCRWRHNFF
ncbi:hypothetical protein F5Y05DRAFT_413639 [Hypoxylon sp. FL0543]|nr:hypothetical protein F5Y05DRAFT_413639 [Hypoxylon sp. FL0543]